MMQAALPPTDLHDGIKRWFSKRFAKDDKATPAYITLYGPNGKPLKRVLGRSAGTRRLDRHQDGNYSRAFVPTGDAFAGLMIPIVESAADALVQNELPRVRSCADARCHRVFFDATKNGQRRWCDMGTCGNRAKAARHRAKVLSRSARVRSRAPERERS